MTTQLPLTPHQSQYITWLLTRRAAGDSVESLVSTLVDSQVDLNPHQVEAALFACRNPLSRGVILADEVGLGKTIEAVQRELEGKRTQLRRELFNRQDEVEAQRNDLIEQLETQLQQRVQEQTTVHR